MKKTELIKRLQEIYGDNEVWLDGGDWSGQIDTVTADTKRKRIIVECLTT